MSCRIGLNQLEIWGVFFDGDIMVELNGKETWFVDTKSEFERAFVNTEDL